MPSSALRTPSFHSLSLHDALPISGGLAHWWRDGRTKGRRLFRHCHSVLPSRRRTRARLPAPPRPSGYGIRWRRQLQGKAEIPQPTRSEEHTSELQSLRHLVCRLLLCAPPPSTLFPYTTLFRSRVDSLTGGEMVGRKGGDYSGIAIPYFHPGAERVRDYRLRRDHPDMEYDGGGSFKVKQKYLSPPDRKSTRLNSSHLGISYAVFCFAHPLLPLSFPTRRSSDLGWTRSLVARWSDERAATIPALPFRTSIPAPNACAITGSAATIRIWNTMAAAASR